MSIFAEYDERLAARLESARERIGDFTSGRWMEIGSEDFATLQEAAIDKWENCDRFKLPVPVRATFPRDYSPHWNEETLLDAIMTRSYHGESVRMSLCRLAYAVGMQLRYPTLFPVAVAVAYGKFRSLSERRYNGKEER